MLQRNLQEKMARAQRPFPEQGARSILRAAVKRGFDKAVVLGIFLIAPHAFAQAEGGEESPDSASPATDSSTEQLDPEGTKTDKATRSTDHFETDLDRDAPRAAPPPGAASPADAGTTPESDEAAYGHGFQFGIRGGLVGGYRMVFRYDESPFCRAPEAVVFDDQQKFCGHAAPLAIDVGVSFAPLDGIEPFVWARFGLAAEEKTNTNPITFIGAGVRLYTMSDSAFKIFIEPALGAELEGGGDNPAFVNQTGQPFDYKKDVVFHIAAGPHFDFARYVGAYASAGISLGILRAIHSSLELQAGIQTRFP